MKKLTLLSVGIVALALVCSAVLWGQEKDSKPGPVTGSWQCVSHGGPQGDVKFSLELQQDGEKVTGSVDSEQGGMDITSGTFKDETLEIRLETPQGNYVIKGKLNGDQFNGDISLDDKPAGTWEGKKAAAENK